MRIEDCLSRWSSYYQFPVQPAMDPFTDEDALQEAQLLDVRFDALRSVVGILLEMRMSLQLRHANAGIIIAWGVRELSWSTGGKSPHSRQAWVIVSSRITRRNQLLGLDLGGLTEGNILHFLAEGAVYLGGDVPGLGGAPPDYGMDDESVIQAQLPRWQSHFEVKEAVFFDPMSEILPDDLSGASERSPSAVAPQGRRRHRWGVFRSQFS